MQLSCLQHGVGCQDVLFTFTMDLADVESTSNQPRPIHILSMMSFLVESTVKFAVNIKTNMTEIQAECQCWQDVQVCCSSPANQQGGHPLWKTWELRLTKITHLTNLCTTRAETHDLRTELLFLPIFRRSAMFHCRQGSFEQLSVFLLAEKRIKLTYGRICNFIGLTIAHWKIWKNIH